MVFQAVTARNPWDVEGISRRRQVFDIVIAGGLDRAVNGLARHWLLVVNLALGAVVGGALLIPLLYAAGFQPVARVVFAAYHLICAQIPSHSYHLWGYQLGLGARNLAIYSALLSGTIAFRYLRIRMSALPWYWWFVTMLPMAWDGFTQLFGLRESNWELRTLTGVIFGLGVCWFILPRVEAGSTAGPR